MARRASLLGLLAAASIVVSCGSAATTPNPQGSPGSRVAGSSAGASSGAAVHTGAQDPAAVAPELVSPPITAAAMGSAAVALGTADRAHMNAAAVVGANATELKAAMDEAATKALQGLAAKLSGIVPAPSGGGTPPAGASAVPSVGASASPAADLPFVLTSYHSPAAVSSPREDTVLLTVSFLLMIGLGGTVVGMFDPKTDLPSHTETTHQDTDSNGTAVSMDATLTMGWTAGVVNVQVAIAGTGTKTDAQTGQVSTMTGSTTYGVSVNPCPDPGGIVSGHIDIADDEAFSGNGKTVGYKYDGGATFTTSVDDQANIASIKVDVKMQRASTTFTADGSDATANVSVSASDAFTATGGAPAGATSTFNVDSTDGPVTTTDITDVGKAIGTFAYGGAIFFSLQSKDVWAGGRCFQLRPTPNGGDVSTGSKTDVNVVVYHWVDKAEIKVPVTATLQGTASIDPTGQPVDSPAKFTFTAGKPKSQGIVTYKVTSKRGIAHIDSTFAVTADLKVSVTGTLQETAGPLVYNLKISVPAMILHPNDDGSVSASGQATVTGTGNAYVCTFNINEKVSVIGRGSVAGPADAPVYRVLVGPGSTSSLGGSGSCPGISVSSNEGDFFGQWSTTLGQIDYPVAGGTVQKSGTSAVGPLSRKAQGTFVVAPVAGS